MDYKFIALILASVILIIGIVHLVSYWKKGLLVDKNALISGIFLIIIALVAIIGIIILGWNDRRR